jgi:hypothetical protein
MRETTSQNDRMWDLARRFLIEARERRAKAKRYEELGVNGHAFMHGELMSSIAYRTTAATMLVWLRQRREIV